jgi:outer membrane lipoprotein SlyB
MRTKVTFIAGFATGYVLGSKAGRGRYDQIREAARAFASNSAVQGTATTISQQATEALAVAKDKATGKVGDKWQEKKPAWMGHGSEPDDSTAHGIAGSNGQV